MRFAFAALAVLASTALPALAADPAACPELTRLQYFAGFVSALNFWYVFSVVLGVVCACILFGRFLRWVVEIFRLIPVEVYEAFGYLLALGLIASGYWLSPVNEHWTSLIGCLLIGGMILLTSAIHELEGNFARFCTTLWVLWSAVAIFYGNEYVGFIAVAALMSALGFSAWVVPFGYVIGFRDDTALTRSTPVAFFILALFVAFRAVEQVNGYQVPYVGVFESGALWLGSFVGYLGLLIASNSRYTARAPYIIMQIVTIAAGALAIFVGNMLGISELLGVGGTFFVLYMIEKPFDIKAESLTAWAWIGLTTAIAVGTGVWWAQNHLDIVRPYLLF